MLDLSSVFALVIGLFIIYSTFATAVAERRTEIGVLRALGATRGRIRAIFLGEGAVLGAIGAAIGLALGLLAARAIAASIGGILAGVYGMQYRADDVAINPWLLLTAFAVGVATSVIAAAIPAGSAARVEPARVIQKGAYHPMSAGEPRVRIVVAAVIAALSALALTMPGWRPVAYAGYLLTIAAVLLVLPVASSALARALRPVLARLLPVEGVLAADSVIQTPRRTSPSVGALMLSVSLVVAFAGMTRTSYDSIVGWMNIVYDPDLFVLPSQSLDLRTARFPAAMGP